MLLFFTLFSIRRQLFKGRQLMIITILFSSGCTRELLPITYVRVKIPLGWLSLPFGNVRRGLWFVGNISVYSPHMGFQGGTIVC